MGRCVSVFILGLGANTSDPAISAPTTSTDVLNSSGSSGEEISLSSLSSALLMTPSSSSANSDLDWGKFS